MSSAILSAPAPPKAGAAPRPVESIWAVPLPLTPEQQKEATRRRAQGATLQELAGQLRPQHCHHAPRHAARVTPYVAKSCSLH